MLSNVSKNPNTVIHRDGIPFIKSFHSDNLGEKKNIKIREIIIPTTIPPMISFQ